MPTETTPAVTWIAFAAICLGVYLALRRFDAWVEKKKKDNGKDNGHA